MTTALVRADESAPLALRPGQMIFDDLQQKALSAIGVKNATKADLAVFAHVCHRMRLDPFTRQIYMIERREKVGNDWVSKQTIQTGIDGFRVVRDRVARETHCEVEFEDTVWFDDDGREHQVWLSDEMPAACRVVLLKHSNETGRTLRYPAVLRTAAYVQMKNGQPSGQWRKEKQPDHMIEKCCEAFATRRAFPNDFSGVYLEEEMQGRLSDDREQATARKVAAADIMQPNGAPADDGVAEGEFADEPPADDDVPPPPDPGPSQEGRSLATPGMLRKLKATLGGLPFRDGDDLIVIRWLTGRPDAVLDDLTRTECGQVQSQLASFADAADSPDEAVSAIWVRFHAANSEAGPADRPSGAPSASGSEGATPDRQPPAPGQNARSEQRSSPGTDAGRDRQQHLGQHNADSRDA